MKYTYLDKTGLRVSKICLDTMTLGDPHTAEQVIRKAIDLGINFFDTADAYWGGKCEENLGRVAREYRDDIVIARRFSLPRMRNRCLKD